MTDDILGSVAKICIVDKAVILVKEVEHLDLGIRKVPGEQVYSPFSLDIFSLAAVVDAIHKHDTVIAGQ